MYRNVTVTVRPVLMRLVVDQVHCHLFYLQSDFTIISKTAAACFMHRIAVLNKGGARSSRKVLTLRYISKLHF